MHAWHNFFAFEASSALHFPAATVVQASPGPLVGLSRTSAIVACTHTAALASALARTQLNLWSTYKACLIRKWWKLELLTDIWGCIVSRKYKAWKNNCELYDTKSYKPFGENNYACVWLCFSGRPN